jgi:hypothetical protein
VLGDLGLDSPEAPPIRDLGREQLDKGLLEQSVAPDLEKRRHAKQHLKIRPPPPSHPLGERLRRDADQARGFPTSKVVEAEKSPQILAKCLHRMPPFLT